MGINLVLKFFIAVICIFSEVVNLFFDVFVHFFHLGICWMLTEQTLELIVDYCEPLKNLIFHCKITELAFMTLEFLLEAIEVSEIDLVFG